MRHQLRATHLVIAAIRREFAAAAPIISMLVNEPRQTTATYRCLESLL